MPRVHVKKTDRKFDPNAIQRAIERVEGGSSVYKAAIAENLDPETFRRHHKKYEESVKLAMEFKAAQNYSTKKIFSDDLEEKLCEYILRCADLGYGLTRQQCCEIAYKTALHNNVKVPQSWIDKKQAGIEWLFGFFRRHPNLSVRKPEACSLARATAFNRHTVEMFYNNLDNVRQRHPNFSNGSRLFNLDETSAQTVQKNPPKIVAQKGKKQVYQNTSAERGTLVTTCMFVNALGLLYPPIMAFPRVHYKPYMIAGGYPGTLGLTYPSADG